MLLLIENPTKRKGRKFTKKLDRDDHMNVNFFSLHTRFVPDSHLVSKLTRARKEPLKSLLN